MATARIAAGFDYIFYGLTNSNGFLIGSTAAGASAGAGEGMERLEGARTIPVSIPEDEVVTVTGDNEPLVSFSFPAADLPSGVLEVAARNLDFEALVQGTKVAALGDLSIGGLAPSGAAKPDVALLLQRAAKKWAEGNRGGGGWEIALVMKSNIAPLFGEMTERAFNAYRYGINMSKSDKATWGASFIEGTHGFTNAPIITIESDNPMHIMAMQGNAVATTLALDFEPVSSAKTLVFINGVRQIGNWSLSGQTITFNAAPASGAWVAVLYEVDEADLG